MHPSFPIPHRFFMALIVLLLFIFTTFTPTIAETAHPMLYDSDKNDKLSFNDIIYDLQVASKIKTAVSYSPSDLTGTWYSVGTRTPSINATAEDLTGNYGAEAGTLTIQSDGTYQWTTNDDADTGTVSISATGQISDTGADDILGWYMSAEKDVMTLVFHNTRHHEQGTIVLVKAADTYSPSDLTGTWYSVGARTPSINATPEELTGNYGAEAGTLTIQSDGTYQWTTNDDADTGTVSISATGQIS
ncbi:hypothetical protein, partial [Desulfobacula sp.]|uniref:hypothetical protein n=1 Tax=Desulfobacula sp. TaxID=2593537 RepID=UPI0026112A01